MTNLRDLSCLLSLLQLKLKLLHKKRKRFCPPEPCCCCPCSCDLEPPNPGPLPPPTPQPTYTELKIPVPQPPGISGLPPFIYFDVDSRFTAAQRQRITNSITLTLFHWAQHYTQKWNGGTNNGVSQWAACSNKFAFQNLSPVWYRGPVITNGQVALEFAMDQFTRLIQDNGFHRAPRAKIDFQIPNPITSSTIRAMTASTPTLVPLSMVINPTQMDNVALNNLSLAGSMIHAWLHRAGYTDPKTTSYFIAEAPMCVMRGYNNKAPSQPDSEFTQLFD